MPSILCLDSYLPDVVNSIIYLEIKARWIISYINYLIPYLIRKTHILFYFKILILKKKSKNNYTSHKEFTETL